MRIPCKVERSRGSCRNLLLNRQPGRSKPVSRLKYYYLCVSGINESSFQESYRSAQRESNSIDAVGHPAARSISGVGGCVGLPEGIGKAPKNPSACGCSQEQKGKLLHDYHASSGELVSFQRQQLD